MDGAIWDSAGSIGYGQPPLAGGTSRGGQVTSEQVDFGSRLRRQRERRQISLSSVADTTKISKSLLASLECGDASQWPRGIYRRAFLREYAAAIGVPSESIIAEFRDLFPETGEPTRRPTPPRDAGSDLRLTMAPEQRWPARTVAIQTAAAILDGAAVIAMSAAVAILFEVSIWSVTGILALTYYSLATASVGGSPALSMLKAELVRRSHPKKIKNHPRADSRDLLHIVASPSRREVQSLQPDLAAPPFAEKARSAS